MKRTETTASTTFTTNGWKEGKDGQLYKEFGKNVKPAFMKEVDQTLFSKEVKDLPPCFWQMPEQCPNDYIKWLLATQIHYLVDVIEDNEKLESSKKKATFDISRLTNIKNRIEDCINYAILFKRYHNADEYKLSELRQKVANLVETGTLY